MANPFQLDFLYDKRWEKYAAEVGIENPWAKYRKNMPKSIKDTIVIDGVEIPCLKVSFPDKEIQLTPSDEERIAYRRQEYL